MRLAVMYHSGFRVEWSLLLVSTSVKLNLPYRFATNLKSIAYQGVEFGKYFICQPQGERISFLSLA